MQMSINTLTDFLGDERLLERPCPALGKRAFSWVTLGALATDDSLAAGWLHVCSEDEAPEFLAEHPDALLLCCCSQHAVPETLKAHAGHTLFAKAPSSRILFADVLDYVVRIAEWTDRLKSLYQDHADYQQYLTESEDVLGNFITISDSAFQLHAHTPNIPSEDPVSETLVALGHHDPQTIERFKQLDIPEKWQRETSFIEVVEDSPICNFPTLSHVFKFRGSYFIHIVMLCNRRPLTQGLIDLFAILVTELQPRVNSDWEQRKGFSQPYDNFVRDLLSDTQRSTTSIAEQAQILDIPLHAAFTLSCIKLPNTDVLRIEEAAWRLTNQLSRCLVTIYRQSLVVIGIRERSDTNMTADDDARTLYHSLPSGLSAHVGTSNPFTCLEDVGYAYQQAQYALAHLDNLSATLFDAVLGIDYPDKNMPAEHHCSFSDAFSEFLLHSSSLDGRFVDYCVNQHVLTRIAEDDEESGTSNARMLLVYLANNCKATPTAVQLHMHRNSIVYHIERIEARYGLDLDDPRLRFELQLVAHFLHA